MAPENIFFLLLILIGIGGSTVAGYIAYIFFKYSDQVRRGVFDEETELHGGGGKSHT